MKANGSLLGINFKRAIFKGCFLAVRVSAARESDSAGGQLCSPGRFCEKVVCSSIKGLNNIGFTVALGQEHNGDRPVYMSSDTFQHFNPGHIRNLPVQN